MTALADQLALLEQAEPDLAAERAILHWFLRDVLGQEDLDTYEFVFDAPVQAAGVRLDAAYLSPAEDADRESAVLNLVELVRSNRQAAVRERAAEVIAALLPDGQHSVQPATLSGVVGQLDLTVPRKIDPATTRIVLYVVAPRVDLRDDLAEPESDLLEIHVYDKARLENVARALANPSPVEASLAIRAKRGEILETAIDSGRIFACPVAASAIARWPGIADRTLFDLNVRLKLGGRRVRESLDNALRDVSEASDFIAFHNGLTVVCDDVARTDTGLSITNFSVVNGAQSVIAFFENEDVLSPDVRVLVKFTVVGTRSHAAREIAIRSNTQNPVTSRNLRALDPRQLTLKAEFSGYRGYEYEIRPDAGTSSGQEVIRNDDAAQLLCAVYNERPWLAVKRLVLFEQPQYGQIFHPRISAAHVILAHQIYKSVQRQKSDFPKRYRGAWKLTSLVATYLVGQMLRVNEESRQLLEKPAQHVGGTGTAVLDALVTRAADVLTQRAQKLVDAREDDYKVDFKREDALRSLASQARRSTADA